MKEYVIDAAKVLPIESGLEKLFGSQQSMVFIVSASQKELLLNEKKTPLR